jgi:hypothetical protein
MKSLTVHHRVQATGFQPVSFSSRSLLRGAERAELASVSDAFEQWLFGHGDEADDGERERVQGAPTSRT